MRKNILILLIVSLVLSGCRNQEKLETENLLSLNTYQVFEPYKDSISGNYINNMINNSYDIDNVQARLMNLSTKYFKVTNNYYQAGQYLDTNKIKDILSKVNPNEKINIDGVEILPKYFSYIHEQNYLDKDGLLSGVSIGLVLNPYQSYKNSYGATLYKEIDEKELIQYAKEKVPEILKNLREIDDLKNVRIIVGLYISASPNSILPGYYKYMGITSNDKITFNEVDYRYYYLDSNELLQKNTEVYNSFKAFNNQIATKDIYISGYGLFFENSLEKASITINSNYMNIDKLIYLQQVVSETLNDNFKLQSYINVHIKINNKIVGLVQKNENNEIYNYIFE